ncbi:hypothetical protein [Lactiplantibacillus daowaiensis]|uniref:Lipoprotein n=1 Tax=Lactiplantibacillus daowaiensis TaxID=2559918 RepID=A0ABW1RXT3_9LACO|nr:hypothetical protein [Lactiplantibacillus daowaiensis]
MKKIKLISVLMLCGLLVSGCSSSTGAMQGKVVSKEHLNRKITMASPKMVPVFAHVSGGHVSTGGHVSVGHTTGGTHTTTHVTTEHTTTHVTETEGTHTTSAGKSTPAVKSVKSGTKSGFSTSHQSLYSHSYYPFWYTGAMTRHDNSERYVLTVSINGKHKRLSVSKRQYESVKVGQYISVDGKNFKVIKK